MFARTLGRSGIQVSATGLCCWVIGGAFGDNNGGTETVTGYGAADDTESIHAIHRALDVGVTFFDTSDAYGCGHSETILGQALAGRRHQAFIATKFDGEFDRQTTDWFGHRSPNGAVTPEFVHEACEASLKRLNTGYIDLQHRDCGPDLTADLSPILEDLVTEGKIRWYGWSTEDLERARGFSAESSIGIAGSSNTTCAPFGGTCRKDSSQNNWRCWRRFGRS